MSNLFDGLLELNYESQKRNGKLNTKEEIDIWIKNIQNELKNSIHITQKQINDIPIEVNKIIEFNKKFKISN